MSGLRWVLLALGVLLIVGVYVWGRGLLRRPSADVAARTESGDADDPLLGADDDPPQPEPAALTHAGTEPADGDGAAEDAGDQGSEPAVSAADVQRVVTIRLVTKHSPWNGQDVVLALRASGLRHGRYGIFHRMPESETGEPLFSVANLTEPGSFDLTNLAETTLHGMSFFLMLPGAGDPVERFDLMVGAARALALELDGELHDDRGSTWSIQRERYVREQIIQYRYQLERP